LHYRPNPYDQLQQSTAVQSLPEVVESDFRLISVEVMSSNARDCLDAHVVLMKNLFEQTHCGRDLIQTLAQRNQRGEVKVSRV